MATKKTNEEQSTELAKNEGAGQLAAFSAERPSWATESARGSEDVGMQDIILPRIDVLQALSPQIKKKDPKYIEGAEQGLLWNTVTGELYGESLTFIPVKFQREFIIWKDRDAGGGFKGSFPSADEAEDAMRDLDEADIPVCEIVETHVHYVLLVKEDGALEEAVLSLAKSKRKVSKKLNTLTQIAGADRFARAYKLSAVEATGPKGDYYSVDVSPLGWASKEQFDKGESMYNAVMAGERKVDRSEADADGTEAPASAKV